MRKLVYFVASTIDGFIAGPSRMDPTGTVFGDGDHLEALIREYPEMIPGHLRAALGLGDADLRHFDTVLEGRVSYQMGVEQGVSNAYPHLRHYVFSRSRIELADPSVTLATDPVGTVAELKRQDGKDIWLCGGGAFAASLRDEIDEIHLKLNPVAVGAGAGLFDGAFGIHRYRLLSVRRFTSGVLLLRYARAEPAA